MSAEQPLQGDCAACGGRLEFPVEWLGAQVACPLCGAATELRSGSVEAEPVPVEEVIEEAVEEEFIPVPQKTSRRWPVLLATVGGIVLLLGGVAALIVWKQRPPAGTEASKRGLPSAVAVEEAALVVSPTAGMFQGGVKAEDLRVGRELFVSRCSECHNLHDPATYGASEWGGIISSMRGKAKLSGEQSEQLNRFLASVRP